MKSNAALLRLKSLVGNLVGIVTWQGFFCRNLQGGEFIFDLLLRSKMHHGHNRSRVYWPT